MVEAPYIPIPDEIAHQTELKRTWFRKVVDNHPGFGLAAILAIEVADAAVHHVERQFVDSRPNRIAEKFGVEDLVV